MVPVHVRPTAPVSVPEDVVEIVVQGAVVRVRVGQDVRYIADLAAALGKPC